jgi:hypothetical protein
MLRRRNCWIVFWLAVLLPNTLWAQGNTSARLVPGVSLVRGVFGDDSPRSIVRLAPSVGVQICSSESPDRALVVEGTFWPTWPENPHFPGRYGASDFGVGWRRGDRAYIRAGFGMTLYWPWPHRTTGTRDHGVAFGGILVAGRDLGGQGNAALEGVVRVAFAPGLLVFSTGAQVPVGLCTQ